MKRFAVVALLALIVAVPVTAGPLEFGLRAGYAIPMGSAVKNGDLNQFASGAVPFQLDVDWRFGPQWAAGGYFTYGPTFVASDMKDHLESIGVSDVSGHFLQRVGAQVSYHFPSGGRAAPWLGIAAGYEWNRYADGKDALGDAEVGLKGWEGAIQGGADFWSLDRVTIGPYGMFGMGQYSDVTTTTGGNDSSQSIGDQAMHQWFQFGLRGSWK